MERAGGDHENSEVCNLRVIDQSSEPCFGSEPFDERRVLCGPLAGLEAASALPGVADLPSCSGSDDAAAEETSDGGVRSGGGDDPPVAVASPSAKVSVSNMPCSTSELCASTVRPWRTSANPRLSTPL